MTERIRKNTREPRGPRVPERIPELVRGVYLYNGESPGWVIQQSSHQATEVRLKSRRKVNRPLRPIPSRAIEAGSGIAVVE